MAREHDGPAPRVGPFGQRQRGLVRAPAHEHGVDALVERRVTVVPVVEQPRQVAAGTGDIAVEARRDEELDATHYPIAPFAALATFDAVRTVLRAVRDAVDTAP